MLTIRQAKTNNFFLTTLERKFLFDFCKVNNIEHFREPLDSDECQSNLFTGLFCCYGIDKIKDYALSSGHVWLETK